MSAAPPSAEAPEAPWPALSLRNITKRFGAFAANDDVSLDVAKGEIVALLGENGAGKTTLMNILFGHYAPDGGSVRVFGQTLPRGRPRAAIRAGVGMVHQHFTLAPNLSVLENILAGTESLWRPRSRTREARLKLDGLARRFGLAVDPDRRVGDLSIGEQQRVEILKALYRDVRILVLDEPTGVLTPPESEHLFATLRRMAAEGLSVVFISHKLAEVLSAADRIVVLRAGRLVGERRACDTTREELAELMVGRRVVRPVRDAGRPGEVVLSATALGLVGSGGRTLLDAAGFELRAGEILGLIGVSGNGQTALARILFGLEQPSRGTVEILGSPLGRATPRSLIALGMARIPEDRNAEGVVGDMAIWENAVLERVREPRFSGRFLVRQKAARAFARRLAQRYDVRGGSPATRTRLLSGGNMQKLILGRNLDGAAAHHRRGPADARPGRGRDRRRPRRAPRRAGRGRRDSPDLGGSRRGPAHRRPDARHPQGTAFRARRHRPPGRPPARPDDGRRAGSGRRFPRGAVLIVERRETRSPVLIVLAPVLAIAFSLALAGALIALAGAPVAEAFRQIALGAFGSRLAATETLTRACPLILTGLSVAVAFRARVWNIGAEGQVYLGALATVALGFANPFGLPGPVLCAVLMLAGALAGALLLAGPLVLRLRFGVDEVVTTLLLNFVVLLFVSAMVEGPLKDPLAFGWPRSVPASADAMLPKIVDRSRLHLGLLIAVGAALVVQIVQSRSVFGLESRAAGLSPEGAAFAGVPLARTLLKVALLSGGLAGLAGSIEVLGNRGYVSTDLSPGFGYFGIVVAMLANLQPLGAVLAALFAAALFVGSDSMGRALGVPSFIAEVTVSLCLLSMLVALFFSTHRLRRA